MASQHAPPSSSRPTAQSEPPEFSALESVPLDPYALHEHDRAAQALYEDWLEQRPPPPPYTPTLPKDVDRTAAVARARDPWASNAAPAWVLARQLQDGAFERYALAQVARTCGTALFGPWAYIEARCSRGSSLRRFADHWVVWNVGAVGAAAGSEYHGLLAATLVGPADTNANGSYSGGIGTGGNGGGIKFTIPDPRTLDLAHWFSACGDDLAARCEHNPAERRAAENRRRAALKPKPAEWGRGHESRRPAQVPVPPQVAVPALYPIRPVQPHRRPRRRIRKWLAAVGVPVA
jgi:hypothetical protein